jgi:hypothetical protein
MLRRWEHGDVFDALVVGLAGTVSGTHVAMHLGRRWQCSLKSSRAPGSKVEG